MGLIFHQMWTMCVFRVRGKRCFVGSERGDKRRWCHWGLSLLGSWSVLSPGGIRGDACGCVWAGMCAFPGWGLGACGDRSAGNLKSGPRVRSAGSMLCHQLQTPWVASGNEGGRASCLAACEARGRVWLQGILLLSGGPLAAVGVRSCERCLDGTRTWEAAANNKRELIMVIAQVRGTIHSNYRKLLLVTCYL